MPSKQFKLLRTMIHYNDNTQESSDRFFKIRPVIQSITEQGWVSHQTQLCDSQVYRRISEVQ